MGRKGNIGAAFSEAAKRGGKKKPIGKGAEGRGGGLTDFMSLFRDYRQRQQQQPQRLETPRDMGSRPMTPAARPGGLRRGAWGGGGGRRMPGVLDSLFGQGR